MLTRSIAFLLLLLAVGCSDAHQAQKGLKKFYKNGGKFECDTSISLLSDTIHINGKDSITYRQIRTICPDVEIPKTIRQTKIELRFDHKRFEDSLRHIRKVNRMREVFLIDSLKYLKKADIKVKRIETKDNFWLGFLIGMIVSLLVYILIKHLFS